MQLPFAESIAALKARGFVICGIEIDPTAEPVHIHPFRSPNTVFLPGNEGQGLSKKQMDLCDHLVYIPQHGAGTASLNIVVATSIVLHHFALWRETPTRSRTGAKFDVALPVLRGPASRPLREDELEGGN